MATEVHHVIPLEQGGTSEWSNLVALCKRCHSRETAKAVAEKRLGKGRQNR